MTDILTGQNCTISSAATVGAGDETTAETVIGDDATIRSGSIIYNSVEIGDGFQTGHNVLIREETTIGDDVLLGTNTVVDGKVTIGSHGSFQTGVYIPQQTEIGDNVFFGPHAVVTNDPYPIRDASTIEGAIIEDHVSVGANATILPGVTIGEGSFVAAGALITEDVPPETLAVGLPATHRKLPESLASPNHIP